MFPPDDAEFEDTTVATAESAGEGGWSIQRGDGWSFLVPAHSPVTPAVGMAARFYGKGIGSTVRGLYLDGRCVFYRTAAEQAARHAEQVREMEQEREYDFERRRAGYDQAAAALPSPFRERIDRFRRIGGRAWRVGFEGYELATCEAAAAIAEHLHVHLFDAADPTARWDVYAERLRAFNDLEHAEQIASVPVLDTLGLSGNQFGCAGRLAVQSLARPELVAREHGAMCPLVGCEEYGCWAARPE
jgi:hypothetical protein